MKKFVLIILCLILLSSCTIYRQSSNEQIQSLCDTFNLIDYDELFTLQDSHFLKAYFIKGVNELHEENLYCTVKIEGTENSELRNGLYEERQLTPDLRYEDIEFDRKYFGSESSYYIGIIYQPINKVSYDGEQLKIQSKEISLNEKKTVISIWMLKYSNDQKIDIDLFEIE